MLKGPLKFIVTISGLPTPPPPRDGERLQNQQAVDRVLRLAAEPCVHYSERTIHDELMSGVCAFMAVLERFYLHWAGEVTAVAQPPKQVFASQRVRGDWRVMPCTIEPWPAVDGGVGQGIDAVKIIGTNEEERVVTDKISVGKALLLHPTDHFVEAMFDVAALSSFRTAAIAVLAYKYCGYRPDDVVGVIGAGRVGFYVAVILREWLGIQCLLVNDVDDVRAHDFCDALAPWFDTDASTADLARVRRDSRSLFLATTSQRPIIDGSAEVHTPFIASVGADADNLSELGAGVLDGRLLVSESVDNIGFGDLRRWHAAGVIGADDMTLLSMLMANTARGAPVSTPVVFVSTGTAVQDALVCRFLHDRLRGRGGLRLPAAPPRPN